MMKNVIIGAGPAGVTAAYELSKVPGHSTVLIEKEDHVGGISATVDFNGNKIDLGPHRFFTKSQRVQELWESILPLQGQPGMEDVELDHQLPYSETTQINPDQVDDVLLYRPRLTRIYYRKRFFDYPVSLSVNTIFGLGFLNIIKIGFSYLKAMMFPRKEKSLEDFFINRFGKSLYLTFFKDYTEKLWGVKCCDIPAEWGAQRVKGISVAQILKDIFGKLFKGKKFKTDQTSLIEAFFYPKYGAGQMYLKMAETAQKRGMDMMLHADVQKIKLNGRRIDSVIVKSGDELREISGDNFLSSMPIRELISKMEGDVPEQIKKIAEGLPYRNVRLASFLLNKLKLKNTTRMKTYNGLIPDVWIYIQEKGVKAGRMEIINNFSPYLVKDNQHTVCITVEYFCSDDDELWTESEEDFLNFALNELSEMEIIDKSELKEQAAFKISKAYPAYFGTYQDFNQVREFIDSVANLYPVGRNGMHKYNNMDHSILTALESVDCIMNPQKKKTDIWSINTEQTYHEKK